MLRLCLVPKMAGADLDLSTFRANVQDAGRELVALEAAVQTRAF